MGNASENRRYVEIRPAGPADRPLIPAKSRLSSYELRCADPIPFDMEYTRDLGYCAARHLIAGGNAALISIRGRRFVPVPFAQMIDGESGRTRIRLVDIGSTRYAIARRYMIRIRRDDFEDPLELAKLAATAHLAPDDFRREFRVSRRQRASGPDDAGVAQGTGTR